MYVTYIEGGQDTRQHARSRKEARWAKRLRRTEDFHKRAWVAQHDGGRRDYINGRHSGWEAVSRASLALVSCCRMTFANPLPRRARSPEARTSFDRTAQQTP
jgi:hypothetical protein